MSFPFKVENQLGGDRKRLNRMDDVVAVACRLQMEGLEGVSGLEGLRKHLQRYLEPEKGCDGVQVHHES